MGAIWACDRAKRESRATARIAIGPLDGFAKQSTASHIAENGYKYLEMADIS